MKKQRFDWSEREPAISRLASGARIIRCADGEPQNEDTIVFRDPTESKILTGTVRSATGYFDSREDGMMYQYTVDIE